MDALNRATETLVQFVNDEDQRVAALKGAWGVGKSFFVRNFIEENRRTLPPFVAFASVFGLRTLTEVRDLVTGCIEAIGNRSYLNTGRKLSQVASWLRLSIMGVAFNIPDLSNAAFWHLAKRDGILVILDDLERVHASLSIDELLGFASSLTQNSKAKVLLIFNEDQLGQERSQALSRYREKVIDVELEYRPSTTELVTKFLPVVPVHDAFTRCLDASGGPNIRLILRAKRAIRDLQDVLKQCGVIADDEDLAQQVRVVWFFYVSPQPVTIEMLKSCYTYNFLGRSDRRELSGDERAAVELAAKGGLQITDLDELMLDYLRRGYFPRESVEKLVQETKTKQERAEYQSRAKAAYAPYTNNFVATLQDVALPVEKLLDDYADKLDLESMKGHCDFLEGFGRPTGKWWVLHVEAVCPRLSECHLKEYLCIVSDPAAREILERRQAALTKRFDARTTIRQIAEHQRWHEDDMAALNALPAEYYREWLSSEGGDFLVVLRSFLRACESPPCEGNRAALLSKLVGVLREIAEGDAVNAKRVYRFLRVPDLRHEEEQK